MRSAQQWIIKNVLLRPNCFLLVRNWKRELFKQHQRSAASVDSKYRIKSPLTIWFKNSLKSNFEFIYFSFNWLEIHKFHAGTRRWTSSINFLKFLKHHSTKSMNTFDRHSLQINLIGKFTEVRGKKVEQKNFEGKFESPLVHWKASF